MESQSPSKNDTLSSPTPQDRLRRRRLVLCSVSTAVVFLAGVITAVILSQTVFKPKRPVTTVISVSLEHFDASILGGARLNVTVRVDLSIRNPNRLGFQYRPSTAVLKYRGDQVGEAEIPGGVISGGGTAAMNLTLTVMADRLLSRPEAIADVATGNLPLSAVTRITGKVKVLGVFKLRVVSVTSCEFNVDVLGRRVLGRRCTYQTKL